MNIVEVIQEFERALPTNPTSVNLDIPSFKMLLHDFKTAAQTMQNVADRLKGTEEAKDLGDWLVEHGFEGRGRRVTIGSWKFEVANPEYNSEDDNG